MKKQSRMVFVFLALVAVVQLTVPLLSVFSGNSRMKDIMNNGKIFTFEVDNLYSTFDRSRNTVDRNMIEYYISPSDNNDDDFDYEFKEYAAIIVGSDGLAKIGQYTDTKPLGSYLLCDDPYSGIELTGYSTDCGSLRVSADDYTERLDRFFSDFFNQGNKWFIDSNGIAQPAERINLTCSVAVKDGRYIILSLNVNNIPIEEYILSNYPSAQ